MDQVKHVYAVILAGGSGTRFWPRSRLKTPKQLCVIGGGRQTMIEQTVARIADLFPPTQRMVVTHERQMEATRAILGERIEFYISEPEAKNTAAALALAAFEIQAQHQKRGGADKPVMVSLHADHVIRDANAFCRDLKLAVQVAQKGYLTLIGIKPNKPSTAYGYIEQSNHLIEIQDKEAHDKIYEVASFREKPDKATAESFLKSGKFLWNSGYFIWDVEVFLRELEVFLPATYKTLKTLFEQYGSWTKTPLSVRQQAYQSLENIAVDHAVLERSHHVAVVEAHFDWFDVGSWDVLGECFGQDEAGNYLEGDLFIEGVRDSTIVGDDKHFVAAIGVDQLIVVVHDNAVLVCPKDRAQDVKKVVEWLKKNQRQDLL